MSYTFCCDLCGEPIRQGAHWARLQVEGYGIDVEEGRDLKLDYVHHYHAGERGSCYERAYSALLSVEEHGPAVAALEAIPTATHQAISARRRQHRRDGA